MLTSIASVAFYEDGLVIVTLNRDLADKVGCLKLTRFFSDDNSARLELEWGMPYSNKGRRNGRRWMYRFSPNKTRINNPHAFGATPATVSVLGDKLILEVDKVPQPLPSPLRELLAA